MQRLRTRAVWIPLCVCLLAALMVTLTHSTVEAAATELLSEADDERAGREGSKSVEAQIGVLDDPDLNAYVDALGQKLLRGIGRRSFAYRFRVVDQTEPNAFALPGGYIFVSRGLLELVNDEDELACVIGHEIAHVAKRHAAAQQRAAAGRMPLVWPGLLAGRMAAYSRDLERTADRDGQILCSAAGYDPNGMATFLESLARRERLERGTSRHASFFDTHPSSARRSSIALVQASELRWRRDPSIGDPREALLRKIEGLPLGQRPEAGVFRGDVFLHPDLDFKLRFPRRWRTANSPAMVGAQAPRGDAVVYLAGAKKGDPQQVAEAWVAEEGDKHGKVNGSKPLSIGFAQGWQLDLSQFARGARVRSYVTFIPHGGSNYRITGSGVSDKELKRTLATTRSFRPLSSEDRAALTSTHLQVVEAREGEDIAALVKRTGTIWNPLYASVYNGVTSSHRFREGDLVKIGRSERYTGRSDGT